MFYSPFVLDRRALECCKNGLKKGEKGGGQ